MKLSRGFVDKALGRHEVISGETEIRWWLVDERNFIAIGRASIAADLYNE
jgi:hypothetical protein